MNEKFNGEIEILKIKRNRNLECLKLHKSNIKFNRYLDMVAHFSNHGTWETEKEGSPF
jgi:hypothetical protein